MQNINLIHRAKLSLSCRDRAYYQELRKSESQISRVEARAHRLRVIWPTGTVCECLSSPLAKNIHLSFFRKSCILRPVLPHERDVRVVTDVGCGMRWPR